MRLAVSNIAWDPFEDDMVATLLQRLDINAIDIAPGKYFPEPTKASEQEIAQLRKKWGDIEITGMQSLLFGTKGLNIFGSPSVQEAMLDHLAAVCRIGAALGAKQLVFGSPRNRDRTGLSDSEANKIAIAFFHRLGEIAATFGVNICLEPNPSCYGGNFLTTSIEVAEIATQISHPAIKMQLDTGALTINHEKPVEVIRVCAPLIGHVHASMPNLLPLGDEEINHKEIASALREYLPDVVVCIEMLATQSEPHLASLERALNTAIKNYSEITSGYKNRK